jgi:hypothetical protein
MGKIAATLIVLLVLLVAAGGVAVMTLDLPAPREPVEKTIPNERLTD